MAAPYSTSVGELQDLVKSSNRILAVCGAGLSAASGLPTFRGAGGLWRNHEPTLLATVKAFKGDPGLVWLFYAWRRHLALQAKPNDGHIALAELAKKKENFLCLTQNVDYLHIRAGHPEDRLHHLHGSLFDIKCLDDYECGHVERDNFKDPLCPALEPASGVNTPADQGLPLLDPSVPVPKIDVKDLPQCPKCNKELLRPGVVWFGESLDSEMLREIDAWIFSDKIDLVLEIGSSAQVSPANGYTRLAQAQGARVVVINLDPGSTDGLRPQDFLFKEDASRILPQLFSKVTNES